MDQKQMESIIEGILFTFGEAVEPSRIAKALEVETKDVVKALEHMKETWAEEGRGVQLTELDGSYQMCTKPELYEYLIRMAKLTQAGVDGCPFGNLIHHCLQAADHQIGDRKDPRRIQRSCRQQTGGIFPGDRTWTSGCTGKTDAFWNHGRIPTFLWRIFH